MALRGGFNSPPSSGTNVPAAPVAASMTGADAFVINPGGAGPTEQITGNNAMSGLGTSFSNLGAASSSLDTDGIIVTQGSDTFLRQPLSAIWTWTQGHLPGYKPATIGVSGSITLDYTEHNNQRLIATGPVTVLAPSTFISVGDGFNCTLNANGNVVTLNLAAGAGLVSSTGATTFSVGRCAIEATSNGTGGASQILVALPGTSGGVGNSILVFPIGTQPISTTFSFSGSLSGYGASVPSLSYKIDSGSLVSITSGTTSTTFAFSVAGGVTAGAHTLTVVDGNGITSPAVSFTATSSPALAINAISAVPTSTAIVINGTTANYVTQPAQFDVSFNNGSTWTVTSLSNTGAGTSLVCTVPSGSAPAAGSYQVKLRDTNSTGVISNAQTLIVEAAAISSAPTTGTSGSPLSPTGNFTLTGLGTAWAALWNGSADQGSRVSIVGASGSMPSFTPAATGTFTLRIYDASTSGNKLAETASITVGSAVATVLTSVVPNSVGNVGSSIVFAFTYTGGDPTVVNAALDGGSPSTVSCTASGGNGTVAITPSGLIGVRNLSLADTGAHATVTTAFYANPAGTPPWQASGGYHGSAPVTPVAHTTGDLVNPLITVNTPTSETPNASSTTTFFAGWSTSQVVPPSGTGWASGIPTAFIPSAAAVTWFVLTSSGGNPLTGWLTFHSNPPGAGFTGKTVFAWFVGGTSGWSYVDPTAITVT